MLIDISTRTFDANSMPRKASNKQSEPKDVSLRRLEKIDKKKLQYIMRHFAEYLEGDELNLRPERHKDGSDTSPHVLCSRYLARCNDAGELKVSYIQRGGKGRFTAVKSVSLQCMQRQIRHTVCKEYYNDVDIQNCHPVLLEQMIRKDRRAPPCPQLTKYVADPEAARQALMKTGISRDEAKRVYLSMINGGCSAHRTVCSALTITKHPHAKALIESLQAFKEELMEIHTYYSEGDEYAAFAHKCSMRGKFHNLEASYMNTLLCDAENECLQSMWRAMRSPMECVLCYDGIMVRKRGRYRTITDKTLRDVERCVEKDTGYTIRLIVKAMKEALDLPVGWGTEKPPESYYDDYPRWLDSRCSTTNRKDVNAWARSNVAIVINAGERMAATRCLTTRDVGGYTEERLAWSLKDVSEAVGTLATKCTVWEDADKQKVGPIGVDGKPEKPKPIFKSLKTATETAIFERKVGIYAQAEYLPYLTPPKTDPRKLNTFGGFPLKRMLAQRNSKSPPLPVFKKTKLYKHFTEHFFKSMREYRHWEASMADMVQRPAEMRSNSSRLFISNQGTGKELLFQFCSRLVADTCKISDHMSYFKEGAFNASTCGMVLKCFEELSGGVGSAAFKYAARLKAETEAQTERVNGKNAKIFHQRKWSRYWFFSNDRCRALFLECGDRRYTVHDILNHMADNAAYFDTLWPELRDPLIMMSAFKYFSELAYDERAVRTALPTEAKTRMIFRCMHTTIQFMLLQFERGWPEDCIHDGGNRIRISTERLVALSRDFCNREDARLTKKVMLSILQTKLCIEKKKYRFGKQSLQGVEFCRDRLQTLFRKMTKCDTYTLPTKHDDDEAFSEEE